MSARQWSRVSSVPARRAMTPEKTRTRKATSLVIIPDDHLLTRGIRCRFPQNDSEPDHEHPHGQRQLRWKINRCPASKHPFRRQRSDFLATGEEREASSKNGFCPERIGPVLVLDLERAIKRARLFRA